MTQRVTGEKPPDKSSPVNGQVSLNCRPGAFDRGATVREAFHRGATVREAFHLEPTRVVLTLAYE